MLPYKSQKRQGADGRGGVGNLEGVGGQGKHNKYIIWKNNPFLRKPSKNKTETIMPRTKKLKQLMPTEIKKLFEFY